MRAQRVVQSVLLIAAAVATPPVVAQDRLARRLTSEGDIVLGGVRSLAQDSVGFLWFGTNGGLLRWDGSELRRWAPDHLRTWVNYMTVCPDGTLYVVEESGTLFRVTPSGATPIAGPGGKPFDRLRNARCDRENRLWVAAWTTVWHADGGGWTNASGTTFVTDPPFIIEGPSEPGVLVRSLRSLWQLRAGAIPRHLLDATAAQALAVTLKGDTLLLTRWDGLFRLGRAPRRLTPLLGFIGRGIDMQRRGSTIWVSFDRYLVAVRPDEPLEIIDSKVLPEGGGLMTVDREGSLWIGTFNGLVQFPEPEAVYWHDQHGFPSAHTRYLARTGHRVWASTWQGLGYVSEAGGRRAAHSLPDDWRTAMPLHVDARGVLWFPSPAGLREVRDGRTVRVRPAPGLIWDMEDAPSGGVWLASSSGLLHAPASGAAVAPVAGSPFPADSSVRQILRARDGRLWLAGDERICGMTSPAAQPRDASWSCDSVPGAVEITDLVELPSGALWASSSRRGVLRWKQGHWETHPGSATLPSPLIYRLRPARDGGVWILSASVPRVRENLASPLGWDVLETITAWQGVTSLGGDVLEDPDSTIWMTTSLGIARVPAMARRATPAPPPVVLVEVTVDGEPADSGFRPLRHRHNRLDVRFAALSYRDPARIRYQVRLAPRTEWSEHRGPPSLRWIDLPAGRYRAEVRASLDGVAWSAVPAAFAVTVRSPWYLDPRIWGLAAVAVLAAAFLVQRARLLVALRLERQRTQIALDLHDEMGSGLGSIGILSGVLSGPDVTADEARRLATKIAEISGELGASLSDIVWSLRPRAGTLEEVATRLAEHGRRLFAGNGRRFETTFPDRWPDALLSPAVLRAVLLIGLEALHNAARHAAATRVTLAVGPTRDGWDLTVEDDGRGLSASSAEHGGLGLESMRRRADEMGATITWEGRPGGGTLVTLRMNMRGES